MTHPLNNDECRTVAAGMIGFGHRFPNAHDHMRAGADWQLEQVMEWLDKNLSNYTDDAYLGDMSPIHMLDADLKEAMRPTPQENS